MSQYSIHLPNDGGHRELQIPIVFVEMATIELTSPKQAIFNFPIMFWGKSIVNQLYAKRFIYKKTVDTTNVTK